jgi:starvation-inducible outer membrane lipoprotein
VAKFAIVTFACFLTLSLASCASTPKPPAVLVVNDENRVRGCRVLGTVADNELEDLQKKAARLGGNVVLLTPQRKAKGGYFGVQDYMTADVYQCEGART